MGDSMSNLQVEKISHTNNTTGLTIDSSGRVLKPNQPAFTATIDKAAWVAMSADVKLPFDDASTGGCFDNNGDFNTSSNRFVAPVSGSYYFFVNIYTFGSDSINAWKLFKNGSVLETTNSSRFDFQGGQAGSVDETVSGSVIIDLSSSDYIEIYSTTGSDYYGSYTYFGGHLIG